MRRRPHASDRSILAARRPRLRDSQRKTAQRCSKRAAIGDTSLPDLSPHQRSLPLAASKRISGDESCLRSIAFAVQKCPSLLQWRRVTQKSRSFWGLCSNIDHNIRFCRRCSAQLIRKCDCCTKETENAKCFHTGPYEYTTARWSTHHLADLCFRGVILPLVGLKNPGFDCNVCHTPSEARVPLCASTRDHPASPSL